MNAKEELLEHLQEVCSESKQVLWVRVVQGDEDFRDASEIKKAEGFLFDVTDSLNFEYDAGYGTQELFGTIWFSDGTYSDRGEYDGSEWWRHHACPDLPEAAKKALIKNKLVKDL